MNNMEQMFWVFCNDNMLEYSDFLQDKDGYIECFYEINKKHYTMEEIQKMVDTKIIPTLKLMFLEQKMNEIQQDFV